MRGYCEIIVKCQLDADWSGWLDGLTITLNDKGHTLISGPIRDQAALYGVLTRTRDLALCLISIKYVTDESSEQAGGRESHS